MSEPQLVTEASEKSSRELVFEEIYRLKLERHALELEEKGYTVVPDAIDMDCLLYTSPSPRDQRGSGMPWSA